MALNDSKFLVQALVRWADLHFQSLFVLHKGEDLRGVILLRQDLAADGVRIWVQETDDSGQRTFRWRFPQDQTVQDADAFIQRELDRDEDLWVLVLEKSDGILPSVLDSCTSDL